VRVQERSGDFAAAGFVPVAVGFSPPDALAALAGHLGWAFAFCSDENRLVYDRLGLGSAGARQVFSPGTRAIYDAARARGEDVARPVEDVRQLGGDALVVAGEVKVLMRPSSPDDRPEIDQLLAAAAALGAH
jgi:hypothetical protein